MPESQPEPFTVIVKRNRFSFPMTITESQNSAFKSFTFQVGGTKPCLNLYVRMPLFNDDNRLLEASKIATLLNVEALLECVLDDINENYLQTHKFGKEILATVDHILKTYFPHVKSVELYDTSYMPCNRAFDDALDLLTYSIALYGKTWYEIRVGAYLKNERRKAAYAEQIAHYISEEFKSSMTAEDFLFRIVGSGNAFLRNLIERERATIVDMYNNARTFPEFFKSLRDMVPKNEKCRLFKGWLERFINEHVHIDRSWQYDINYQASSPIRNRNRLTRRRRMLS